MKKIILFIFFVLFSTNAFSIIYPITPKYVSLKKNKVNLRWNASLDAPIHFIYQKKGLPVLIINEHGNWKKIRDVGGTEGWIHRSMLSNKKTFINKKKQIHKKYIDAVSTIKGLEIIPTPDYAKNNYWLNILYIDEKKYHKSKKRLINQFLNNNIQVRPIWHLNHMQKPYKNCQSYKIIYANKLVKNCICLPSSFGFISTLPTNFISS